MKQEEMPVGFDRALSVNSEAMQKFSALSEEQKQMVIDVTHSINSREEMHRYVEFLVVNQQ